MKNKLLNQNPSHPENIMLAGIVPVRATGRVMHEGTTIGLVVHAANEIPLKSSEKMGRIHGYETKKHTIYLCAGTACHIGDFSDYACYVAVLFLPDRVSVMKLQKRGVVRISDTTFLRSRHTGRRNMLRTGTAYQSRQYQR